MSTLIKKKGRYKEAPAKKKKEWNSNSIEERKTVE